MGHTTYSGYRRAEAADGSGVRSPIRFPARDHNRRQEQDHEQEYAREGQHAFSSSLDLPNAAAKLGGFMAWRYVSLFLGVLACSTSAIFIKRAIRPRWF